MATDPTPADDAKPAGDTPPAADDAKPATEEAAPKAADAAPEAAAKTDDKPAAAATPAAGGAPAAKKSAGDYRGPGGPGGRGPGGPGGRGPGGPGGRGRGPGGPGGRPGGPGGFGNRNQRGGGRGNDSGFDDGKPEMSEKVVFINRCAKVVKGGRRFSFSALVVAGDHEGQVGIGFGKANEVAECIRKASDYAKRRLVKVPVVGSTVPHEVLGVHGGGRVLLKPASAGTGIVAGGSVRAVLEAAGYTDVLTKSLGSNNHSNVVKATIAALQSLRTKDEIYKLRGKKVAEKEAI